MRSTDLQKSGRENKSDAKGQGKCEEHRHTSGLGACANVPYIPFLQLLLCKCKIRLIELVAHPETPDGLSVSGWVVGMMETTSDHHRRGGLVAPFLPQRLPARRTREVQNPTRISSPPLSGSSQFSRHRRFFWVKLLPSGACERDAVCHTVQRTLIYELWVLALCTAERWRIQDSTERNLTQWAQSCNGANRAMRGFVLISDVNSAHGCRQPWLCGHATAAPRTRMW